MMESGVWMCALLALGLYLNTLPAEFAYDDSRAIQKNPDLLPESSLSQLFYNDFWGTPLTHSGSHKSYRPLTVLTFRLNYHLGALHPFGYHLGNVVLHALVTAVFTHLAKALLRRQTPAVVAGLLFASHPIHTEAVAGVVGRADVLACLFFLLAFLCYMRYCKYRDKNTALTWKHGQYGGANTAANQRAPSSNLLGNDVVRKWLHLVGCGLCTAAAMFSKEQGVTILAVCAVYDIFLQNRLSIRSVTSVFHAKYRTLWEGLLSLSVMGVGFVGFRIYFMGNKPPEFAPADNPASDSESLLTRVLTYYYLPFLNFWLLCFPMVLSFDWSMEAVPLIEKVIDLRNLCTLTFYGILGYVCVYIVRHLNRSTSKTANGNGYVPHIQAPCSTPSNNGGSSSHHSSSKNSTFPRRRWARRGSTSSTGSEDDNLRTVPCDQRRHQRTLHILVISLAMMIFPFIPATNIFFYVGFVIAERVLYIPSMGFCLLVAQGACVMYDKCWRDPLRWRLLVVGVVCVVGLYGTRTVVRNQDWRTEENLYKAGVSVNPAKAWGNLANILNAQGKIGEAEEAYRAALRYRANMADVHYNLGILLQEQKRYTEAIESYRMAIQCRPRLTMAYLNLGIVHGILGHKEEAEKMYRHCAEIDISGLKDPRLHENTKISALYNLGRLLADQEQYQEAIEVYQEAIRRRPGHYAPQSLYNMLGEAYSKVNSLSEAERWYEEALRAKSDHIPAHLTMAKLLHRRGKIDEAENWFKKAQNLDPKDSSVYQHYGQFLGEIGRHQEAAQNYVTAAQQTPDDFELVFNTANALRQAGRNLEAETYYRKAAKLRPNEATAHMNLGAMLHYNGRLMEAEQSYMVALRHKPDDHVTQANLKKLRNLINKAGANGSPGNGRR